MSSHESLFDYEGTLQACARGERQALQRLYEQESARLLGVVVRLVRDRELAEDIVHDAFLKIWTRAASFDASRGSARGWIFSVTRHLALNNLRNTAREVRVEDDDSEDHHEQATLEGWQETGDAFDWRVNPGRITACLEPDSYTQVASCCLLYTSDAADE